jgi:hypothetical protein
VNNLYWIYIDYLIRMSTPDTKNIKTEFGTKDPETPEDVIRFTRFVNREEDSASSDGDSSDNEMPSRVRGSRGEKYRKKYRASSDNNTNLSALSGVSTSDIAVSVPESNRDEIDETALSGRNTASDEIDETALSGRNTASDEIDETALSGRNTASDEIDANTQQTGNVSEVPSFETNSSSDDDSSIDVNLLESEKTEATRERNVIDAARDEDDDIRRVIEENTYIRTHINGVLDGDDDALFMTLSSPDPDNDATIFYKKRYETNDTDQKELIPFIFLFAKTYKKIDDSVKAINTLLQEDNKISEINSQLTTLQGQLQMFYELPLKHKNGNNENLIENPDYDFVEAQPYVMTPKPGDKPQIYFQTKEEEQKNWEDFMKYFDDIVSESYKKGEVQFEPNAKKSVKKFKEKYLTKKSNSFISRVFGPKQGGNKKQTRRPVMHKKRQTRRK